MMMEHIYLERDGEGGGANNEKKKKRGLKCWGERGKEGKRQREGEKKNEG